MCRYNDRVLVFSPIVANQDSKYFFEVVRVYTGGFQIKTNAP
jgi:hypothetical protein